MVTRDKRLRWRILAGAVLLAAVLAGVGVWRLHGTRPKPITSVRVAAIQCYSVMGKTEHNRDRLTWLIRQAAAEGARIVVTPECAVQGYAYPPTWLTWSTETGAADTMPVAEFAETVPGPSTEYFRQLASELGIYLCLGLVEQSDGRFYNSQILLAPDGTLAAHHRKRELWPPGDGPWCTEGDLPPQVVHTPYGRLGLMICYDFHSLPEALARDRADIVLYSVGWYGPNEKDWFTRQFPRKVVIPYGFAVVAANWCGLHNDDEWPGRGCSCVIARDGTVLALATRNSGEEVVLADLPVHCDASTAGRRRQIGSREQRRGDQPVATAGSPRR